MLHTLPQITMKELEEMTYRALQAAFTDVMAKMLQELDNMIAENRDKKRYYHKDKRWLRFDSVYGYVEVRRNYYLDRETGQYVYLLDQYLAFDGQKGMSPVMQDMAMEMAVTGTSYRQAAGVLEKLLGYRVMSHESIRQYVLQTEVIPQSEEKPEQAVLFVEVDGLYTKSQEKGKHGREIRMASVHQGWERNGKRTRLVKKRHYVHRGDSPFWEGFEQFLLDSYGYDPTYHHLVINGDGAGWITACRDHFRQRATYVIDRFHVAREVRRLLQGHPRYRAIRKKLAAYDAEGFLLELNSAAGTLEQEEHEEALQRLITQLSAYPEALADYRKKLETTGIRTAGFRPMGSAEGMMSVFAKRLKHGRSWCTTGLDRFIDVMVALKDRLVIKTLQGQMNAALSEQAETAPKSFKEKLNARVVETTRHNIAYLQHGMGKPVTAALKGLRGF